MYFLEALSEVMNLNNFQRIAGIVCFVLAVIIFIFESGLRRIYSGIFFVLIGILFLRAAVRPPGDGS